MRTFKDWFPIKRTTNAVGLVALAVVAWMMGSNLANEGTPSLLDDAFTSVNLPNDIGNGTGYLNVRSSGMLSCNVNNEVFLKWDLSSIDFEVDHANPLEINLHTIFHDLSLATGVVELWSETDDTWSAETITFNSQPLLDGNDEFLASALPSAGTPLLFAGQALFDYLNEQTSYIGGTDIISGDDMASFRVRLRECKVNSNLFIAESNELYGLAPYLGPPSGSTATPSPTVTDTPTDTLTSTPTSTAIVTPSHTYTPTPSRTPTIEPTNTPTPTETPPPELLYIPMLLRGE